MEPAPKRPRTDSGAAAAASAAPAATASTQRCQDDPFAALFEAGTDAAVVQKLRTSQRVKVSWRMKSEVFSLGTATAEDLENTICTALCIPEPGTERIVLTWVADEDPLAGSGSAEKVPRFEATIPPDFDLEDLAELASKAQLEGGYDEIQKLLEGYRLRYGARTDTWKALAINDEWRALAEDAVFARLEKRVARTSAADNYLEVDWLQEPPWGPCEWLMLHKRKDHTWSNQISPAMTVRLNKRVSSDSAVPLEPQRLDSACLVLLSPGGKDVTGEGKAEILRVGAVTKATATATLSFPELGIKEASEKFPSKLGMRQGKKTQRGARGWYHMAVYVPGLGVSLLWDDHTHQPCDLVVKHFRNKWGENPGEPKRGPYADHTACSGSHVVWVDGAGVDRTGAWQLRCGGWRPGDRAGGGGGGGR